MSAVILAFPAPSPIRALVCPADCSAPFTSEWCAKHLPLIEAGLQLLACDDPEFGRRCQMMRDADGRAMLDELAGQLQRLGTGISNVADGLGLTAERIRASFRSG